MAEEQGGIIFGIRMDNSQLSKDIELSKKLMDSLTQYAENQGNLIDNYLSKTNNNLKDIKLKADNQPLKLAISESKSEIQTLTDAVIEQQRTMNSMFSTIKGVVAGYFTIDAVKGFLSQMFNVRSEFAKIQVSFETFLGSSSKAQKLFNEIKQFGATTPMQMNDLASAANQMLGFGIESEKVMPYLKALGDVSGGDSEKFKSLSLAFSQASASGKLMGQDLMQMINAGFNPLQQMSVDTGKSIAELKEEMSKGAISAEMLQTALVNSTKEGGKYHDMLLKQSKTLSGALSNLEDNVSAIFNELGEASEDTIINMLNGIGELAQNWKDVVTTVAQLATVYGTLKASDFVINSLENIKNVEKLNETFKQHGEEIEKLLTAEQKYQLAMDGLNKGTEDYNKTVKSLLTTQAEESKNFLDAISQKQNAEQILVDSYKQEVTSAKSKLEIAQKDFELCGDLTNQKKLENAQTALNTAEEKLNTAQRQLNTTVKAKETAETVKATATEKLNTLATLENSTAVTIATVRTNIFAKAQTVLSKGIAKVSEVMKASALSNPYALALVGAVALGVAIYKLVNMENAHEKAQKNLNEQMKIAQKNIAEENTKIDQQIDKIKDLEEGSAEYKNAIQNLIDTYPDYLNGMDSEISKTELLTKKYKDLKDAIEKKNLSEAYQEAINANNKQISENVANAIDQFNEKMEDLDIEKSLQPKLQRAFSMSLDGISDTEIINKYGQEIFDKMNEIKAKTTFDWSDLFYILPTAPAKLIYELYQSSDATSALEFAQKTLNGTINISSSNLMGLTMKTRELNSALKDANQGMQDFAQEAKEEYNNAILASTPYLKQLQDEEKQIKDAIEATTKSGLTDVATLQKNQQELKRVQNLIAETKKKLYGDDNAEKNAKAKREKELNDYATFAKEYIKIEQERNRKIQEINNSYTKNDEVKQFEKNQIEERASDSYTLLKAQFPKISEDDFATIRDAYNKAINTPIADASKNLSVLNLKLEKIADGSLKVTKQENAIIQAQIGGLTQILTRDEKQDFSDKENAYKDFQERLVKIEVDRLDKVKKLQEEQDQTGVNNSDAISRVNEFAKAQIEILQSELQISDEEVVKYITTSSKEVLGMTFDQLSKQLVNLNNKLAILKTKSAKGEDVAIAIAEVNAEIALATNQFENLEKKEENAIDELEDKKKYQAITNNLRNVIDIVANVGDELDILGDDAKETISFVTALSQSSIDLIENILLVTTSSIQGMKATSVASVTAMRAVESASVILAIISAAVQIITKIVNFIAGNKIKKANKQIESLQNQVDDLQDSYDTLADKIDKAYSKSAVKLIDQQKELLSQQKILIQQQIDAEKTKKNKKQDKQQIKEWQNQIKEINAEINNQDSWVEKMIGTNYNSVLEDFTSEVMNAMNDAETSVNDAVANIAKTIKKNAVQQNLNDMLQPFAESYSRSLANAMLDGVISETEQNTLLGLENSIAKISEDYLSQFNDLWERADEERTAMQGKGIQSMSQDTAEEMNGRLTQIQSHTFNISNEINNLREFASLQLAQLQGINSNTKTISSLSNEIKNYISDIVARGVKIKN